LVTYGQQLADLMCKASREIMQTPKYQLCYPGTKLSTEVTTTSRWETAAGGKIAAFGLGGPITGRGYRLGIVDDYMKNREEAESENQREKQWESFTNVFLTRKAPVSVTIILATRWHMDDLIGRAIRRMEEDANFPRFRVVCYPAWVEKNDGTREYLFPERFTPTDYLEMEATCGRYGTQSLLLNDPQPRHGNILAVDRVKFVTEGELPAGLTWIRAWDLASTSKQLVKSDPDWTVGMLMAKQRIDGHGGTERSRLFVKDVVRGRWDSPERDRRMRQQVDIDGRGVHVVIETGGAYRDVYQRFKEALRGVVIVEKVEPVKDKVLRAGAYAPVFDGGEVYMVKAEWNQVVLRVLGEFPSGPHDDDVDALSTGWEYLSRPHEITGVNEHLTRQGLLVPGMRGRVPDERWHLQMPTRRA